MRVPDRVDIGFRFGTFRREILRPKSAKVPDTLGVNRAHRHPLGDLDRPGDPVHPAILSSC